MSTDPNLKSRTPADVAESLSFDLQKFFPYLVRVFYSDVTSAVSSVYQSEYDMTPAEWRSMVIIGPDNKLTAWNTYGGSMWEITRFLGDLLVHVQEGSIPDDTFAKIIEERIVVARSMFKLKAVGQRKKQLFRSIAAAVSASADGSFDHDSIAVDMGDNAELEAELGDLVRNNILALDPTQAHYKLQGRLLELGLARYVSELASAMPTPNLA